MLLTAMLLDYFGLVGFARKQIPWQKVLGALLMAAGVLLMTMYTGADLGDAAGPPAPPPEVEVVVLNSGDGGKLAGPAGA
jgi:hypothetical protein